ncbi:MAG: protein kinase, partial [Chloroflexota bacterium]
MLTIPNHNIVGQLYESNHSLIYRTTRTTDNQPIILKILNEAQPSPRQISRFRQEFELTKNLDISGVIKAYELSSYQHRWIMSIEDFGGSSLNQLKLAGSMTLTQFLQLAIKIVGILEQIHQKQVIHKDINPSNIVYNLETGQVKVIDFGISTVLPHQAATFQNANTLEGTLAYIAP